MLVHKIINFLFFQNVYTYKHKYTNMVKKMHLRMRRTKKKMRGGRRSDLSSIPELKFRRSRSRSRSRESPGRIRIINSPPNPEQHQPHQQPEQQPNQTDPVIAHSFYRFKVKCMNGETHTSPYIHARGPARIVAREYCSSRGGVDGIIEYERLP